MLVSKVEIQESRTDEGMPVEKFPEIVPESGVLITIGTEELEL